MFVWENNTLTWINKYNKVRERDLTYLNEATLMVRGNHFTEIKSIYTGVAGEVFSLEFWEL